MLPLFSDINPEQTCSMAFGTWTSTPNKIGCFNTIVPINSVCSESAIVSALDSCEDVNATAQCDSNNIGCYY
jgi:hypothetical protein